MPLSELGALSLGVGWVRGCSEFGPGFWGLAGVSLRRPFVRISRQLGHARPSITLDVYPHEFEDVYPHEFEEVTHADDVSEKLAAAFAGGCSEF